MAATSSKPRVKIGRNGLGVQHRNAIGQMRIHAAHPSRERARGVAVKMHHLRSGVHACVGTPSSGDGNGFARNLRERVFQHGLDGGDASGLFLETEKCAAVVGKGKGVAGHGGNGLQNNWCMLA